MLGALIVIKVVTELRFKASSVFIFVPAFFVHKFQGFSQCVACTSARLRLSFNVSRIKLEVSRIRAPANFNQFRAT